MPTLRDKARHVIVLMLENRSFDNLLGHTINPAAMPAVPPASYALPVDPDHSHLGVMWQLLGQRQTKPPTPTGPLTMNGFADSYEDQKGHGPDVLRGFEPAQVPVLSTLALEFATCTRWFCSVPGQTWPNRNYAHAGTSDGEVDIRVRLYENPTVFERLEQARRTWRVYHEGPAQIWCFPRLWPKLGRNRFDDHDDLLRAIRKDRLPDYAFVEPDHGLVFREARDSSNSQHPHNNTQHGRDFCDGERLLHTIYSELVAHPEVWRKTLLIVTYDEHGGFADHVAPPDAAIPPDDKGRHRFGFTLLGPRVPTLLISPWVPRGKRDDRIYDHTAIPRALRELFAPGSEPLGRREASANLFLDNLSLAEPRSDVPRPTPPAPPERVVGLDDVVRSSAALAERPRALDDFQESLVELSQIVDQSLRVEDTESVLRGPAAAAERARPARSFTTEAERQFYLQDVTRRLQRGSDT